MLLVKQPLTIIRYIVWSYNENGLHPTSSCIRTSQRAPSFSIENSSSFYIRKLYICIVYAVTRTSDLSQTTQITRGIWRWQLLGKFLWAYKMKTKRRPLGIIALLNAGKKGLFPVIGHFGKIRKKLILCIKYWGAATVDEDSAVWDYTVILIYFVKKKKIQNRDFHQRSLHKLFLSAVYTFMGISSWK